MNNNSNTFPKLLTGAVLAIVLGVAIIWIGRNAGEHAAEATKTRLELIWPDLMTMPANDRALLAGLSMTCRMERRPVDKEAVIACLREAATDPDAHLPKIVKPSEASTQLESLLRTAPSR